MIPLQFLCFLIILGSPNDIEAIVKADNLSDIQAVIENQEVFYSELSKSKNSIPGVSYDQGSITIIGNGEIESSLLPFTTVLELLSIDFSSSEIHEVIIEDLRSRGMQPTDIANLEKNMPVGTSSVDIFNQCLNEMYRKSQHSQLFIAPPKQLPSKEDISRALHESASFETPCNAKAIWHFLGHLSESGRRILLYYAFERFATATAHQIDTTTPIRHAETVEQVYQQMKSYMEANQ